MAATASPPTVGQEDLARLRDLVRERTGMALPPSRQGDLERAARRAAREVGARDAAELLGRLRRGRGTAALDALVSALDVHETHFFRDPDQLLALERRILPQLIAARRPERRLRLWSAACSTGEEAYTLAILLDRLLPDLARWDLLVLATDVNGRSLERAALGRYGPWSFRGVPPAVTARYFTPVGDRLQVADRLRAMVSFARLNLVEDPWPSPRTNTVAMDLVLCRNVLLYFDPAAVRSVVGRLREALADDGRLLVSQVEAVLDPFDGLEPAPPGTAAYRKATPATATPGGAATAPPPPVARKVPAPHRPAASTPPPPAARPAPAAGEQEAAAARAAACEQALDLWRGGRAEEALRRLHEEAGRDPLAPSLHYLLGLVRLDLGLHDEAMAAFRRCTYADPGFVLGHLAKAGELARRGRPGPAAASLRAAVRLVAGLDPDEPVPHGDGLTVGQLRWLASAHRALLDPGREARGG
jgi:chemotaxis protein methyltransferase CheR